MRTHNGTWVALMHTDREDFDAREEKPQKEKPNKQKTLSEIDLLSKTTIKQASPPTSTDTDGSIEVANKESAHNCAGSMQ
jgi:hypothetical protein